MTDHLPDDSHRIADHGTAVPVEETSLLLLSGGLDSTALAALHRPDLCLVIDYGQRSAEAETRAATAVCRALSLRLRTITLKLPGLGGGLLLNDDLLADAPSPEWWPYRNQLLVTVAASVALQERLRTVLIGTVASDGERHADGTPEFISALDHLLRLQEGGLRVRAPALGETTMQLLRRSNLGPEVLGWTVSCHRANYPCGTCPGCWKRTTSLTQLGILPPYAQSGQLP